MHALQVGPPPRRIALVTDFGEGPYVGQVRLVLSALIGDTPVVPLISDLPPFRPDLAGALLPGLMRRMPPATLYLCVVDPGVGSERGVLAADLGSGWMVGPDNGLLAPALRRAGDARVFRIGWRPAELSASFHGRDLFAPIAARIVQGELPDAEPVDPDALVGSDWPGRLDKVCYVDRYGNLLTGIDADEVPAGRVVRVNAHEIRPARTFSDVPVGTAFWYRNAFGLLEIAVNQGRADRMLGVSVGDPVDPG